MITPWLTKMKNMLISCIKDEKIVSPPLYFHPNTNPKTKIVNGMKYLDDILSNSFTCFTMLTARVSLFFIKLIQFS